MSGNGKARARGSKKPSTSHGSGTEGGSRFPGAPLLATLAILIAILVGLGVSAHQRNEEAKKAAAAAAAESAAPAQPAPPPEAPPAAEQVPSAPLAN